MNRAVDLRINLFGAPVVTWGETTLPIRRRLPRALLYRLATTALQPLSRDELAFLFWPDIPGADARRNLTRQLTHLRRSLPDAEILITTGGQIELDSERVGSDAASFQQVLSTLSGATDLPALQEAMDLCQGEFLAGVSLSNAGLEAVSFYQQALQKVRHLSDDSSPVTEAEIE